MRETVAVMHKVYRVECSVSTHGTERTAMTYQQVWDEMGVDLSNYFFTVSDVQSETLVKGVLYLMKSLSNNITSLKLCEVPFEKCLYHWRIPDQSQHLDIELRVVTQRGRMF